MRKKRQILIKIQKLQHISYLTHVTNVTIMNQYKQLVTNEISSTLVGGEIFQKVKIVEMRRQAYSCIKSEKVLWTNQKGLRRTFPMAIETQTSVNPNILYNKKKRQKKMKVMSKKRLKKEKFPSTNPSSNIEMLWAYERKSS